MAFKLDSVVPWGRNLEEYRRMFLLDSNDMTKNIAGFGDGPASFNFEAKQNGTSVTSYDIIYQFSGEQLRQRIEEVRKTVMAQMKDNMDNYVWTTIKDLDHLEELRMSAMKRFLADYDQGLAERRYVYHELPKRLDVGDQTYDIGLSSHFLLMYTVLGYEFHVQSITEMLRVCREIRIFPIVDLDANQTDMVRDVIRYVSERYAVEIKQTNYEFQKGDNHVLIIKNK